MNAQWVFEHDRRVYWKDLVLLRAENFSVPGQFSASLQEVGKLNSHYRANLWAITGQVEWAEEIERLIQLNS